MATIRERLAEIERGQQALAEQLHRMEDQLCQIWDLLGRAAARPGEERADGTAR